LNEILKQRLVGALILVALGVVFWPIIFVQPEHSAGEGPLAIPPPPDVSTQPVDAPDPGGLRGSPAPVDSIEGENVYGMFDEDIAAGNLPEAAEGQSQQSEPEPETVQAEPERESPTREQAPAPLEMDADGVPLAWTIQVATVSNADKAEKLRQRLLALNHKAYVATVNSGGKRLYRVGVGPQFERAGLEKLQSEIDQEFGVKSLIVRYLP
jgi:DedD protein